MLRAADRSQLLGNRAVWMGTESVWPSNRIGLEMELRAYESLAMIG